MLWQETIIVLFWHWRTLTLPEHGPVNGTIKCIGRSSRGWNLVFELGTIVETSYPPPPPHK